MEKLGKGYHVLAYEKAMKKILQLILDENMRTGDKLPPERTLAAMFGISRSTIREALQVIAANGIVESKQGSGIYVLAPEKISFLLSPPDSDDELKQKLVEVLEIRMVLEKYAFCKVAKTISEAELNQLYRYEAETFEVILGAIQPDKPFGPSSTDLERRILQMQENKVLIEEHDRICIIWKKLLDELHAVAEPPIDRHSDHLNILKAIGERNPAKVAKAVEYHLSRAIADVPERR